MSLSVSHNDTSIQILFGGQSYRNFIEAVHSPFTRYVYRNSLKLYMKYRGVENCDQLLEGDLRTLQQHIIDYIISLREENKLNANTINSRVSPVKKFYETNDIELKWNKIKSYIGRGRNKKYKKDRPYTHLEIQKMLEKADQRGKVAILLMSSSGIRVGALTSLTLRNLERIDKYNIYKITVYENEDEEYITFCTPECAAAIDSYLEYRQRHGEHSLNENAPVIREEFDINDEIRATRPRALEEQSFRKMIRDIGLRSGVMEKMAALEKGVTEGKRQRRPVKETHGFRKFFQTTAINNGMSPLYAEFLMGHSSGGLALESYVRPSENDLLEGNDKISFYKSEGSTESLSNSCELENKELVSNKVEYSNILQNRVTNNVNILNEEDSKSLDASLKPSESSESSATITEKLPIYRLGHTDRFACRDCKIVDDIHFMKIHDCSGSDGNG